MRTFERGERIFNLFLLSSAFFSMLMGDERDKKGMSGPVNPIAFLSLLLR
jgi:hypothetical protein